MDLLCLLLIVLMVNNNGNAEARTITDYYDDAIGNAIEVSGANDLNKNDVVHKNRRSLINDIAFYEMPPPKLIQKPGTVIEIVCGVVGKPLPTVEWVVGDYPTEEVH